MNGRISITGIELDTNRSKTETQERIPNMSILIQYFKYTLGAYILEGPLWSRLYGSWIYNYICSQCISPLQL